jgi:hypothetical protein
MRIAVVGAGFAGPTPDVLRRSGEYGFAVVPRRPLPAGRCKAPSAATPAARRDSRRMIGH